MQSLLLSRKKGTRIISTANRELDPVQLNETSPDERRRVVLIKDYGNTSFFSAENYTDEVQKFPSRSGVSSRTPTTPLCSRNFQNVKLRLDFVEN